MPSNKNEDVLKQNAQQDYKKSLNQNLKQLEIINQLEFYLNTKDSLNKNLLKELLELKTFIQKETVKSLKNLNK